MRARTTVVALLDGGLWVHSPGRLSDELRESVAALGPVRALIAPNRFHHLWIGDWRAAYPDAVCAIAPGLVDKRPDLADATTLDADAHELWSADIEQHIVGGIPKIGELVFCHKPSRTLIATDTAYNVRSDPSAFARFAWRMMGAWDKFGPSRLERMLCRDKAALGASLERILDWDFDRVVMAHGEVLATGGKDGLATGYAWALKTR
jgi:hypothetical protein